MNEDHVDNSEEESQRVGDATADADIDPETISGRKLRRLEEKQYVTGRIGETCRYIGFGLIILFYTIATSGEDFPKLLWSSYGFWVKAFGILGLLTVVADYSQYLAGDIAARAALRRDDDGKGTHLYKKSWKSYRARNIGYVSKQVFSVSGAVILIGVMIAAIIE